MKTRITCYLSKLCPRCAVVRKNLRRLTSADPTLNIEEIDVVFSPRRAWRDGIRMIPALKVNDRILSGLYLSSNTISEFINRTKP